MMKFYLLIEKHIPDSNLKINFLTFTLYDFLIHHVINQK